MDIVVIIYIGTKEFAANKLGHDYLIGKRIS